MDYLERKATSPSTKQELKTFESYFKYIATLTDDEWLSDLHVDAFLRLVKLEYNTFNGLCNADCFL